MFLLWSHFLWLMLALPVLPAVYLWLLLVGELTFGRKRSGRSLYDKEQPGPKQIVPVPPGSYRSAAIVLLSEGRRTTASGVAASPLTVPSAMGGRPALLERAPPAGTLNEGRLIGNTYSPGVRGQRRGRSAAVPYGCSGQHLPPISPAPTRERDKHRRNAHDPADACPSRAWASWRH